MRNIVITTEGRYLVTDKEAFKFYRENAKFRDKEFTKNISTYRKIINEFYSKIADHLVENEGGVFIKNLGYFSVIMYPKKQVVKVPYNKKGFTNFLTNNRVYLPTFFSVVKRNPLLNFWVMDRTFSRSKVKERLSKNLLSGKKYKTFISTIYSLYTFKK